MTPASDGISLNLSIPSAFLDHLHEPNPDPKTTWIRIRQSNPSISHDIFKLIIVFCKVWRNSFRKDLCPTRPDILSVEDCGLLQEEDGTAAAEHQRNAQEGMGGGFHRKKIFFCKISYVKYYFCEIIKICIFRKIIYGFCMIFFSLNPRKNIKTLCKNNLVFSIKFVWGVV